MANQKKRDYASVYSALNDISKETGVDFGLSDYTPETFKQKYFTGPGNINNLYNNLDQIAKEANIDFGLGTRDEWLESFGYKQDGDTFRTLEGKRAGGHNDTIQKVAKPQQTSPQQNAQPAVQPTNTPQTPVSTQPWVDQDGRVHGDLSPAKPDNRDASQFGFPYKPDTQMTAAQLDEVRRRNDFTARQLQKEAREQRRRNQPIVDTGSPEANEHIIKPQGEWEDDLEKGASRIVGNVGNKISAPAIDDAIAEFEKKADEASKAAQSGVHPYVPGSVDISALMGTKAANEARDPEKMLDYLKDQIGNIYNDASFIEEVGKEADKMGIDRAEYVEKIIKPQIEADLTNRLRDTLIKREMPKSNVEYILGGLSNSIAGMIFNAVTETKGQREIKNQAEAMTENGQNQNFQPGTAASLAKMGVSFAADAPFFGLYGRVSGTVAKKVAERQIQNLMAKGLSEGAARSIVGASLENSVGARMKNYLMQHVISSSMTLGGYNATSEIARQTRDKEGYDLGKIAGSTAEGMATGAAFGLTGGAVQALSQPLSGIAKVGAKLGGFGAEAETLYATEELAKMAQGEEGFENPFEGSVEALMKLGVMKASSPGGIMKIAGEIAHPIKSSQRQRTGVNFTPEEQDYIRNSAEGKNLVEALSGMHPELSIEEVNGKKRLTKEGEQQRQQLSDNYERFMTNTEIPAIVKQKVATMLGGVYRPGLETGADIIHNPDGSVILKTRDKDGNCVRDIKFDSFSDAEQFRDANIDEFRLNDAVNMWNATTTDKRVAVAREVAEMYGLGPKEAVDMVNRALNPKDTSLDRDQYNFVFGAIERNAYPADELNVKRRYWEGQQLSPEERHFALVDAQVAEERLALLGQEFADEVIGAADYPDEKMAELAARKDITKEQLEAAVDYYNKSAAVKGMMEESMKGVDNQVEAANAVVSRNTHPDTGALIEAVIPGNDINTTRNVYVTAGHFQLTQDGRITMTDNSGMVIVRDKETGEISVLNPQNVTITGIQDPRRLMEYNDSMDGLRGELMRETDDSIELNPDTPTEAANGDMYIGADGKQYMAMATEDEMGNVVWSKIEVGENGEPVGEPMPFDMAEYRKAKSDEIDAANRPEEEIQQTETPLASEAVTEGENQGIDVQPHTEDVSDEGGAGDTDVSAPPSRIPVDEKGKKIYEKATPENTLAELTEKYGEEKAQKMIAQIADAAIRELEKIQQEDTSSITDMADLVAHEDALAEAQRKVEYWQNLLPKENVSEVETVPEPKQEVETPVQDVAPEVKPAEAVEPKLEPAPVEPAAPVTPAEKAAPVVEAPEQPKTLSKQEKIFLGSADNNIGRTFTFTDGRGIRSELTIDGINRDGQAIVTRRDFDELGNQIGETRQETYAATRVGEAILNNTWQKVKTYEEKLREAMKGKPGANNIINVLADEEIEKLWKAYEAGDKITFNELYNEYRQNHFEDLIAQEQNVRTESAERTLGYGTREDKLRRLRRLYQGNDDAELALSDEMMQPQSLEEYIADLLGDVPQNGTGQLAYYSYGEGSDAIVGLQDETGFGSRGVGGDTKGFNPWLAPKGKGMSLAKYAEVLHSQLPEAVQEQYTDQDVRNALIEVLTSVEKPTDIPNMILRNRARMAEEAMRREEQDWIDSGVRYQKAPRDFATRLQRGIEQVNTEPSEKQKEAGNYMKGHVSFGGYDYTIENPAGSIRRGRDADGNEWEQKMNNTYGYILGKFGKDGDHLDMFINDKADLDNWNGNVYVVDQVNPKTGEFDEHKVLYGFDSEAEAREAYLSNYSKGWKGLGEITGVPKETFDKWLDSSTRKQKEFADHSIIKQHMVERTNRAFDSALQKLDEREISIDDPELMKEYGLKNVTLSKMGDYLTLTHFISGEQGKGNGTRFMKDLARLADEKGWTLALTPDDSFGATSVKRLKDFYKRFGFVDNRGRNTDFYTRESMLRRPKDYQPESPERREQMMRDAIVEHLRQAGINVSTDWKLGQRILDRYNGIDQDADPDGMIKKQKVEESFPVIGGDVTKEEITKAMDSHLVKSWLSSGKDVDQNDLSVFNLFGVGTDLIRKMARARLGINNKYHVSDGVFNNAVESLESLINFAKEKGLDPAIADKYNLKDGETVKKMIDSEEPIYSDEEIEAILKVAPGAKEELKGIMQAFADENRIREEMNNLRTYDNGNAITKAFALYDIAVNRLRDQYGTISKDTRNELLKRIATTPINGKLENVSLSLPAIPEGQPMFFKTPDGQAYGYTYKGKIYLDPRIATSETPIHEYSHLWAEMKRQQNPDEWNEIKDVMLNDRLVKPIIDRVKRDYVELTKEGKEDDFVEEVITQFSGKRGAERLREMANEIAAENGGVFGKAEAITAMQRLKNILNRFWEGVAKMMGWKYTNANQIADKILSDMLNGVNPRETRRDVNDMLRSQQEIERTLMGVHNLSEEKLRKALKVGGLANPSMAVVDTKQHMHTDYGDISLIPRASLIDAHTGRNAGTFTADAWTPSYPQVVRRMTDKGQTKFWKDIRKLNEEAGEVASQMRMAFDTWLDKEAGQDRLAYWYLSEKGLKPELVLNENPYDKEVIKRLDELTDNGNKSVSSLPEEQIKEIADMYHAYKEKIGEPVTPAEERIKKLEARIDPNKQSPFTNLQKFRIEELQKYGELLHNLSDFVDRAGRASFYEGKPNVDATMRKAQEVVKSQNLQADFDKWLDQKAQDYGVEEWLFNGTDYQGRQKWVRNTLDNASKLMKKEGLNGAVGWSSLGSWIATVANKEKTLEGIRRNKKNLNTTEEEHDAWKEQWGEKLYPLVEKLGNGDVFHGDNILKDILEHKDFAGYYKREYGKELTKDEKGLIDSFIKEVRTNFPTGYFETKFERPVMLDEFEIAVVPETTSPDIVEALKNAGLDVRTYDASDYDKKDENRTKAAMDAVSGRDDIRFQMVGRKGAAKADEADNDSERIRTLNVAKDATKAGIDPKAIKYATGWEQGKDGKWRYEIPDADVDVLGAYEKAKSRYDEERSKLLKEEVRLMDEYERLGNIIPKRLDERYSEEQKAKYRDLRKKREDIWERYLKTGEDAKSIVKDGVKAKLSDIIGDDNELFKYYPELKDMKVSFTGDMNTGTAGSYGEDGIELSANELRRFDDRSLNNENVYGTLLHEVQHAIQEIEGFAPGGNLYTSTTEEGINAIIDKKNRQRHEIQIKLNANRKILNNPEELKAAAELDRRSVQDEKVHIEEEVDRLAKEADDIFLQIERINHYKSPAMTDARDLYDRLAGEVESRNVTNRMNMSPEERRNSLATNTEDVPREDQVIIMGNGKSMNISDEAPKFQKTGDDIHSDNFKEFFGDWEKDPENASKVVDNKGKPLVVYHGTGDDFHIFDIEQLGKSSGNKGWFGEGFYFTPWEGHAKGYASQAAKKTGNDERVMPVYLNVRNPQVIDVSERENFKPEEGTDGVIVTIKFPKGSPFSKSAVKYDKDSYIYEIKVDNPNQIKSATENIGTYDPNNADIRYQREGSPEPELTPEERQYWNKWDADMKKWRERNAIAEGTDGPSEKPTYQRGESAIDYAKKLTQWNREKALWQTAPKLEDYRQKREDKDLLEAARENEQRYPNSPLAKMRRVAAEFQQIRRAMSQQKAYDKATVKAVTDFAQEFMKQGFGDNLSRGEMERMLSSVKNATGAKDIRQQIDNIMNILVDNQLRNLDQRVQKLSSTRELSKTAQGVEKQGKLELKGQRMIQAFRQAREERMTPDKIRERLNEVAEKMARNDDEAPMWEQEYEGLSIALQYAENIEGSREEFRDLDRAYKDAVESYKTSGRSYKAQQELLESIDQARMENKIERIGLFGDIIGRLEGNIAESMEGAKEFVQREKDRVKHIQQIANFDLAGKDMGAMREVSKGKPANFFLQPLATFEQMLRQFGSRNANGEGYLFDHFMRSWMDSTDQAYVNELKAKEELDTKAREVFGDKVKRWSDLYQVVRDLPTMDVEILDGEDPKTFTLNQGNLLYIYMADKMTDGRMKLRKMGIEEEDVQAIKDFLDPRLVELGDWLQDDYLVKKRTEYNKVHERMFGAPMAAIDHYFPLRILGDARVQEQDVANMADQDAVLPSTITGNIIKRRRNALPLDILHTDALSLAIEHVEDMEKWAATAEWNKDINTLLSYTTFRNKVKNMKTIYGSGDALWNTFADTARMAAGTYMPKAKPGSVDATISNIAKGVTAAKISFRAYTAFKQILSAPAFLHDVNLADFAKYSVNPYGSWKWAMENMPVFKKRWKSRQVGDTRLMDDPTDWKMWKTNIVKMASMMGMSPNALVDGVTCAVGARAIYDARYKKYKKIGATDEVARKRALQDAEIGYNLTQQSSEGAFVSRIQKDRTVAANMLSVFRNSSMAYTRQWVDAARNLKHRMQSGYKEDSIDFMTKQFEEQFDLDKDQAKKAAEAEYAREGRRDVARLLNMMFGVTMAWNLGASLPYLLLGDDDETKKEMMTDALIRAMVAGPTEGFAAGNLWSELMSRSLASEETRNTIRKEGWGAGIDSALEQGGDYEVNPLPLMADLQGMIKKMGYDKFAAAQDVFNIVAQSAVGVNPQTFTDMWNAIMDYAAPGWDGHSYNPDDENFKRPKELALFMMRLLNAPTSSWRNKYIDELGMNVKDAKKLPYDEMAKRYAHYKHWKDAPIMGWLRGEEGRAAKMEKIQKQFDKAVEERMQRLSDKELESNIFRSQSTEEKRKYAKIAAQRLGLTPANNGDSKKADNSHWYQELYQQHMLYEDIKEDETLAAKIKDLRDDEAKKEINKRLEWIREGKYDSANGKKGKHKKKEDEPKLLNPGKKQLADDNKQNVEDIMKNIRKWRKEALEIALRAETEKK